MYHDHYSQGLASIHGWLAPPSKSHWLWEI